MITNALIKIFRPLIDSLPDYAAVNLIYFRHFGRLPNLKRPKTLNEKIAWRKLYQHDPRFPIFADKIAVKAEIAKLIGGQHVVETLWVGDHPEDIPFDNLTPPYVIKVNHSSGGNIIIPTAQNVDQSRIVASMREQLGFRHGHKLREWGYGEIPRKVLVERMVQTPDGEIPQDYKFFTYHGRVHFVQLDCARFKQHRQNIYDREWNPLPVTYMAPPTSDPVSKPANLGEMIEVAERIGAEFDFVRVDLYLPPQGILFGEATFYPNGGVMHFHPEYWDARFGEPWKT
jgi:hypothetical protein